jgi:hypothetical protein
LRQWLIFGLCCAIAVCINGNGFEGVVQPLRFAHLQMLPLIDEWKPSNPKVTPFFFGVLAATLVLVIWKRPRLPWTRWLLLAGFLGLAMLQARHQAMLAIVAAMILPQGFRKDESEAAGLTQSVHWVALGGAAFLVAVRAVVPLQPPENDANPWNLIAAVPPKLRSEPVLNGYSMGGPLILSGIRPYIDGRGDMYGDEHVLGYYHMARGDREQFASAVQRWNIRWAIVPNDSKGLTALLDSTPGWRRIRSDKVGTIYVRS